MTDTLTHDEIDGLEGRELELAVARALGHEHVEWGFGRVRSASSQLRLNAGAYLKEDFPSWSTDHYAAMALCTELGCDINIHFNAEPDCWWHIKLSDPIWTPTNFSACGKTIGEAALRCWLKWKLAQDA